MWGLLFATSFLSVEDSRFVSPFFRGSLITAETRSAWASVVVPVAGLKPACQLLNGVDWFISGFLFHSGEIKQFKFQPCLGKCGQTKRQTAKLDMTMEEN